MRTSWAAPTCRGDAVLLALKALLLALVVGYLAVAAAAWWWQERLLFYPQPASGRPRAPEGWRVEDVALPMDDGTLVAGALLLPPVARPPLVIYFGGNAEEVTAYAEYAPRTYGERAVLLVNYRGYGQSRGHPGQAALVSDAIAIHDWAAARPDIDGARVALHGRSLGSGVAVQLAAARGPRCIVLTSPFDSARDVARGFYPWLPVSLLMRHPFDSQALAPRLRMPMLMLVGQADSIIAPSHSERLAGSWAGPVERRSFAGLGHNDVHLHPDYDRSIREFLDRCL